MAFLDETGLAELWSLIQAEDDKLAAADVKIATGSYTGTGKYGSSNKNSLTFDFVPKVVFIVGGYRNYTAVFVRPDSANEATGSYCIIGENATYLVTVQISGKTMNWYHNQSAGNQMNDSGYTYRYLAIG